MDGKVGRHRWHDPAQLELSSGAAEDLLSAARRSRSFVTQVEIPCDLLARMLWRCLRPEVVRQTQMHWQRDRKQVLRYAQDDKSEGLGWQQQEANCRSLGYPLRFAQDGSRRMIRLRRALGSERLGSLAAVLHRRRQLFQPTPGEDLGEIFHQLLVDDAVRRQHLAAVQEKC